MMKFVEIIEVSIASRSSLMPRIQHEHIVLLNISLHCAYNIEHLHETYQSISLGILGYEDMGTCGYADMGIWEIADLTYLIDLHL